MNNQKYKFKQGFKRTISANGVNYKYVKYKGDIIEGYPKIVQGMNVIITDFKVGSRVRGISVPIEYLSPTTISESKSSFEGSEENTSSKFTLKNILIGVVGIVVVYGILKATKIIK